MMQTACQLMIVVLVITRFVIDVQETYGVETFVSKKKTGYSGFTQAVFDMLIAFGLLYGSGALSHIIPL